MKISTNKTFAFSSLQLFEDQSHFPFLNSPFIEPVPLAINFFAERKKKKRKMI